MKETIIAKRIYKAYLPNSKKLVKATAKFCSLGGQEPYFSITTDHGCDHDSILQVMPELRDLVNLHLCKRDGSPMHSISNAVYHAKEGDVQALIKHWGMEKERAVLFCYEIKELQKQAKQQIVNRVHDLKEEIKRLQAIVKVLDRQNYKTFCKELLNHKDFKIDKKWFGMPDMERGWLTASARIARILTECKRQIPSVDSSISKQLYDFAEKEYLTNIREKRQDLADYWLAELQKPSEEQEQTITLDSGSPVICIEGKFYEFDDSQVNKGGYLVSVDLGFAEYYLAYNSAEAGEKAKEYWGDMYDTDKQEFICLVGEENILSWAMGEAAGPGSKKVGSLEAWLDLWLDTPEEQWAGYDGREVIITINQAAAELLDMDAGEIVGYRLN